MRLFFVFLGGPFLHLLGRLLLDKHAKTWFYSIAATGSALVFFANISIDGYKLVKKIDQCLLVAEKIDIIDDRSKQTKHVVEELTKKAHRHE